MPRPRLAPVLAPLVLLAACASPAAEAGSEAGSEATADGGVTAVSSAYALSWLAARIAPAATLTDLSASGADPHDFELSPSQRAAFESADVVLYMGDLDYQPQVEQAAGSATGQVVSAAEVAGEDRLRHGPGHGDGHGDGHGAVDAHLWFDAGVTADVAARTAEAFAAADPGRAGAYAANAEAVAGELRELREDLDGLLGGECAFDEAIVGHAGFGYLLAPYGLTERGVTGTDAEAGASSGELAALVDEVRATGVRHVLADVVEGRADAEALAAEADVELLDVSSLDVVDGDAAAVGYPDLVRRQAEQFATALGCA